MLTITSYAARGLEPRWIGSLSDALPGAATAAPNPALGRLSFPLDPFFAIPVSPSWPILVIGGPAGAGENDCHRQLQLSWYHHLSGCSGRSQPLAAPVDEPTSGRWPPANRVLDLLRPPMAIPSGDRPLPLQGGQEEAWNSAKVSFGYGGREGLIENFT